MTDLERRALDHMVRAYKHTSKVNNDRLKTYCEDLAKERGEYFERKTKSTRSF